MNRTETYKSKYSLQADVNWNLTALAIKYHTVGTVSKSCREILETQAKSIQLTHLYMTSNVLGLLLFGGILSVCADKTENIPYIKYLRLIHSILSVSLHV